MGCYINPHGKSKEQWLEENAAEMRGPVFNPINDDVLICLIDNGIFTAAGVAYDEREAHAFARPDGRPKRWFVAKRAAVRLVSDLAHYERHLPSCI